MLKNKTAFQHVDERTQTRRDLRERLCAVFREHGGDNVDHDVEFRLISRGNVDKNVLGVQSNLAVVRIDDGRHGENLIF